MEIFAERASWTVCPMIRLEGEFIHWLQYVCVSFCTLLEIAHTLIKSR